MEVVRRVARWGCGIRIAFPACLVLLSALLLAGCGGSGGSGGGSAASAPVKHAVRVSWNASRAASVNRSGGGYHVFYSQNPSFRPGDRGVGEINVPFQTGSSKAPTTTTINLGSGTWTIRVQAYSALTPPGGSGGGTSALSAPVQVKVP